MGDDGSTLLVREREPSPTVNSRPCYVSPNAIGGMPIEPWHTPVSGTCAQYLILCSPEHILLVTPDNILRGIP
jgi:hypothetical protein